MEDSKPWWTTPRAIVWVATRSDDRAKEAEQDGRPALDTATLDMKLLRLCGPSAFVPLSPDAGIRARRAAVRKLKEKLAIRTSSPYEIAQKCLLDALRLGLPSRGSRSADEPLEVISVAEWNRLTLSGFVAADQRTGKVVWHNVQIDAEIARKVWLTFEEMANGNDPEAQPATVAAPEDLGTIAVPSQSDPPGPKPGGRLPLKVIAAEAAETILKTGCVQIVRGWRKALIGLVLAELRKRGYDYEESGIRKAIRPMLDAWESKLLNAKLD
jgi:hypothetical protein